MLLTHYKAKLFTLFCGCRFCRGIKAISFIFMFLIGLSLERSYSQSIDPLDLLNFDGTARIASLSSGSREFLELGVEFARCDALLYVIFGDSKIDNEPSVALNDGAKFMFETSYPNHARMLDFYRGLVGFDKQYEMWYEYGDIYSVSGPNLSKLLIIFMKGWFMTEELKTSNEVPQGHLDLFISRRESAFSSALISGNARHPEIHSKVSDCTSLGAYWGLYNNVSWTQQEVEEKKQQRLEEKERRELEEKEMNRGPDCSTASRVLDNLKQRRSITPDGLRTWIKLYDGCPETEEVKGILAQLK